MMIDLDEILTAALEPVLRGLAAKCAPRPRIRRSDWQLDGQPAAMMWGPDGTGMGLSVVCGDPAPTRIARAAEQVKEWAIEEIWGTAGTNWPPCPWHPTTHSMAPVERAGEAVWTCPADDLIVALIGSLGRRAEMSE